MAEDGTAQVLKRIEEAVRDLNEKVEPLIADHVRRADLDGLRRELAEQFKAIDERYYSRRELDPVLRSMRAGIRSVRNAVTNMQTAKAKEWQTLAIQGAAIVAIIYTVLNIAHQYIK